MIAIDWFKPSDGWRSLMIPFFSRPNFRPACILVGSVSTAVVIAYWSPTAWANPRGLQPDGSLGAEASLVVDQGDQQFSIQGGATRAQNLFHSFERFGVPESHRVFLQVSNPAIENILLRVTGRDRSDILGTLGVEASGALNPNLYLLNPNGIRFGPNAQLELGGSFIASTAESLNFADGFRFSTAATESPLLSISQPLGLSLGSGSGRIVNQAALQVAPGKGLTFAANQLEQAGILTAPGGEISLIGVEAGGEVELGGSGEIISLQYNRSPGVEATVTIAGAVDVSHRQAGGSVRILGDRIALEPGSVMDASGQRGGRINVGGSVQSGPWAGSDAVYIAPGAKLSANGIEQAGQAGIPGEIIVWSESSSQVHGTLTALGNQGGLLETSSAGQLNVSNLDLALAPGGTWLLDPRDIVLNYETQTDIAIAPGNPQRFTATGDQSSVNIPDLESQLNAGANIIISTSGPGEQEGNITADGFGISKTSDLPASLTLQADNNIELSNFGLNAQDGAAPFSVILQADADGNGGGDITIENGGIETRGGDFIATAGGQILFESAGAQSNSSAPLPAGETSLNAPTITLQEAGIARNAFGSSDAGSISINANAVNLNPNSGFNTLADGDGQAASISVNTRLLAIDGGGIVSEVKGDSSARPITINAEVITLNQGGINGNTFGEGSSAEILINSDRLSLLQESGINNKTFGPGDAGGLIIDSPVVEIFRFSSINSQAEPGSSGQGGKVQLTALGRLTLADQVGLSSNTSGTGDAGQLIINVGELSISQFSGITTDSVIDRENQAAPDVSQATLDQLGNAGSIEITARQIVMENEAGILAETQGAGQGGQIQITTDSLILRNVANIANNAFERSSGDAGSLEIIAETVLFEGQKPTGIGSEARGTGRGGNVSLTATDIVIRDGAGISLNNQPTGERGGDLLVKANRLLLQGLGIISETRGPGPGGSIMLEVAEQLTIENSEISTSAEPLDRDVDNPVVLANLGAAGDIEITTPKLFLSQGASIRSESFSQDGGNINLNVPEQLLLQENSNISATAGSSQTGGNGGNVTINSGLIVAIPEENSDISANAFSGSGGNVSITTEGLVGLVVRDRPSPQSDITASSQTGIQGNIVLEQPDVDPSRGLAELPGNLVDPSDRIAQGCRTDGARSSFVTSGRGGIPQGPDAPLQGRVAEAGWIEVEGGEVAQVSRKEIAVAELERSKAVVTLAEAQTWRRSIEGEVRLVGAENRGEVATTETNCKAKPVS